MKVSKQASQKKTRSSVPCERGKTVLFSGGARKADELAFVNSVSVLCTGCPVVVSVAGVKTQLIFEGSCAQLRATDPW